VNRSDLQMPIPGELERRLYLGGHVSRQAPPD
jgi:hypothetical protein